MTGPCPKSDEELVRQLKTIRFHCPQCKKWKRVVKSRFVRAHKDGLNFYCGRECSGLARRIHRSIEEKKLRKRDYDIGYRAKNIETLRVAKAAYYQRTRDPEKERQYRKKHMWRHVEYCRRPEYRARKHEYDLQLRAEKEYGPFAEVALILRDMDIELDKRMTWTERHQVNGLLNKSTLRKREYAIQTGTTYPR